MQEITRDNYLELLKKVEQVLDKVDYNSNATVTIVKIKKGHEIQWKAVIVIQ